MKRNFLLMFYCVFAAGTANANDFVSAGDGTVYTLETLAAIDTSGVTKDGTVYTMADNITIAAGDRFQLESGVTLKMGQGVTVNIYGTADLDCADRTLITRATEDDKPKGIYVRDSEQVTTVSNLDFEMPP